MSVPGFSDKLESRKSMFWSFGRIESIPTETYVIFGLVYIVNVLAAGELAEHRQLVI